MRLTASLCCAQAQRSTARTSRAGRRLSRTQVVRGSRADDCCRHAATATVLRALIVIVENSDDIKVAFVFGGKTLDAVLRILHKST
jgi:hypothetical protein